jgi:mannose-1-phosphate guanylyltransferase
MLHAVIMAGGAGTRFWPVSRQAMPKQLLSLIGNRTMLQMTLDRLGDLVPRTNIVVVTAASLVDAVRRQLEPCDDVLIVGEPMKRDTAPCIGLAALLVARHDAQATLLVMPADHVIEPNEEFRRVVRQAVELVDERPSRLVTFGVRPTYPAETYGYIQRGPQLGREGHYAVVKFREKPKAAAAVQLLASGDHYWNAGIFVWRADTILDALARHQPDMLARLQSIVAAWDGPNREETFCEQFEAIRGESIDYAVMEHAADVAVIEAPFAWDDVGSWQAVARLAGADAEGNTLVGRHLVVDTRNSILRSDDEHLVVAVGLEDLIVVHTPDVTLVARRGDEESVRKAVQLAAERGWKELL